MQPYILTRMFFRPVNLNFQKFGEYGFFCSENREILAETDILKLQRNWTPGYFYTLSVRVVNRLDPQQ